MTSESPAETPESAETSAGAKKTSRAGRNLPASIAVGVGLVGLVVATLFIQKEAFIPVVVVALADLQPVSHHTGQPL